MSTESPRLEALLTREECGKLLRVSVWTLDAWVRAGRIKSVKLGGGLRGRVCFDPADIKAFIEQAKTGTTGGAK